MDCDQSWENSKVKDWEFMINDASKIFDMKSQSGNILGRVGENQGNNYQSWGNTMEW